MKVTHTLTATSLALAALALVGCGASPDALPTEPKVCPFAADYELPCGLGVHIDATRGIIPAWVGMPSDDEMTCRIAVWVEQIAGAEPGATRGLLIVWTGEYLPTNATESGSAAGLYHGPQGGWATRWTEVSTWQNGFYPQGPTQTGLAHELLHALIWDPGHTDPRWSMVEFDQVELSLPD
jgi:hypothetical protein